MQKKAAILLAGAALIVAGVGWAGWSFYQAVVNEPTADASGPALHIDVVAPKEPEPLQSTGMMSVGELSDGYDHTQTMSRPETAEDASDYTSWDDNAWSGDQVAAQADTKRVMKSDPSSADANAEASVKSKIPSE